MMSPVKKYCDNLVVAFTPSLSKIGQEQRYLLVDSVTSRFNLYIYRKKQYDNSYDNYCKVQS